MKGKNLNPWTVTVSELKEPVVIIDRDYNVLHANKAAREVYGEPSEGTKCYQYIHGYNNPCWKHNSLPCGKREIKEKNLLSHSTIHIHKVNGKDEYFLVSCSNLPDRELLVFVHIHVSAIIREMISHGIMSEEDLSRGFYQRIKKLVSKERFIQILSEKLKQRKARFLSILDLRGLTFINKFYGMVAGDMLIKSLQDSIFKILKGISSDDSIFARAAGDEYIILHATMDRNEVDVVEKAILEELTQTKLDFLDEKITPKVSLGTLELNPETEYHVDEVLRLLSHSKSLAKDSNEKRYILGKGSSQKELVDQFSRKKEYAGKVHDAISQNSIDLFFQPVIDLSTGEIFDLEALVRIPDMDEYLPASAFIDLIYELDLIFQLDNLVFEKIISYNKKLSSITPRLFVNLSPSSLKSSAFRKLFEKAVKTFKKGSVDLFIELTEQSLFENIDVVTYMHEKYGLEFGIDDFGTGYASFKTVSDLSNTGVVSTIKIDGSLIRDINSTPENLGVVKAITSMAKALSLNTIAEYIDTKETLETLVSLGIDHGQGYLFTKPEHLDDLLKNRKQNIRKWKELVLK